MNRRLPVLLKINETIYTNVELKKPAGKVLCDTAEAITQRNDYNSLRKFIVGCVTEIKSENNESINDELSIKRMCDKMSHKNAEYLAQEIMIDFYDGEDYIEGVYFCPRCPNKVISEKKDLEGIEIDTRDRISDLKVNFMENPEELLFDLTFTEPITIKTKKEVEEIESITLAFPTMEQMIQAVSEVGQKNGLKLQYAVWAKAIVKVNGSDVDKKWCRTFGKLLFEINTNIKQDLNQISKHHNSYGVDSKVEKECYECGKVWQPTISTSNFFAFALQ